MAILNPTDALFIYSIVKAVHLLVLMETFDLRMHGANIRIINAHFQP
jgi:hypothetical protein